MAKTEKPEPKPILDRFGNPRIPGYEPKPGNATSPNWKRPSDPMPSMKRGGTVKKTGPHRLHKGEKVIPARRARKKR